MLIDTVHYTHLLGLCFWYTNILSIVLDNIILVISKYFIRFFIFFEYFVNTVHIDFLNYSLECWCYLPQVEWTVPELGFCRPKECNGTSYQPVSNTVYSNLPVLHPTPFKHFTKFISSSCLVWFSCYWTRFCYHRSQWWVFSFIPNCFKLYLLIMIIWIH